MHFEDHSIDEKDFKIDLIYYDNRKDKMLYARFRKIRPNICEWIKLEIYCKCVDIPE